ncbi:MAG TPA: 30S ribosomal protein S6e [Thermoplasmata archaeon]|nr:30S ribosomal protein S6e [Thermoplasmata archaeon]
MVELKVVISEKEKSYPRTVTDAQVSSLLGRRIGETVGGDALGLPGYTLKITGGSDKSGFPLRGDLPGARQTRVLVGEGMGFHAPRHGMRRRRTFRGNTVSEDTVQVNLVVEAKGPKPIAELLTAS